MSIELPRPRRRGLAPVPVFAALVLATLGGGTRQAAAQETAPRRRIPVVDSVYGRITEFSPASGAPGAEVTVRGRFLPAVTPVQISFGGTRSGFEVLAQMMTNVQGEITETVEVPVWAEPDRTYLFIVVDMYFAPLAVSEIFHATDADGTVLREGRITDEGGACRAMRGEDGELYTLVGETEGLERGDQVVVEGTLAESSDCAQGTPLEVTRVRPAPG